MKYTGLSSSEVLELRRASGENRLPVEKPVTIAALLLRQVTSPLIYIIVAAAGISLALGEYGDFFVISVVIVIDVILGFVQEFQAQRSYRSLKSLLQPTATALRNGERTDVEVWELVPGDVVLVAAGDKIPADGNVLESVKLSIDEAVLTGESESVAKCSVDASEDSAASQVYMGTTVISGRATLRITSIGISTELGKIASSLAERHEPDTPLQTRLSAFSRMLTYVVVAATGLILVVGLLSGRGLLDMLRTSIVLAIAAVPEGLIIAVTVILVLGMRKILQRQGLVKKLLAVETLGSVTVICTDKTGTLTEGRMTVDRVEFTDTATALRAMVLCNNLQGAIDLALWNYADQALRGEAQRCFDGFPRVSEEPFTSEAKFMATTVTSVAYGEQTYFKGAPEVVLAKCAMTDSDRSRELELVDTWSRSGMRLLGLAASSESSGTTWLGLVALQDPLRSSVPAAVEVAQQAGVRTIMVTGDYAGTAVAVAHAAGITGTESVAGEDLHRFSDQELQDVVRKVNVFARIRPQDKLRIVQALQANGEVVAMVGDGVNDAPALTSANIGVVVGMATDVSRETADLILLDNNFSTIVASIEEGRTIFDNIQKVVAYVLSNSFAEVVTIFVAMMMGLPSPLLVAQILWIHLICDGPSDVILGFERAEPGSMLRPPRALHTPILDRLGGTLIGIISSASALFALIVFSYFVNVLHDPDQGRSIVFASFAINSMVYIVSYRSMRLPLWRMPSITQNLPLIGTSLGGILTALLPFMIPALGKLLHVVTPGAVWWGVIVAFAMILVVLAEGLKLIAAKRQA